MLPLTPMPLQTAGERALFAELSRWDTGGAVRGAVVASLPMTTDGLQRRAADAVLFVPEGLAVVRVAEVVRQSGVVTATPDGPWTIAPGKGPGEVLQLGGGGSTPLDGLMRAGMDAAVRLRRAGLEPGRIARLTVLVGKVAGLEPPDGDLGEGDQVAICEPRSLLLGIARASRYAGVDNPRLWTTADVRAALEALGLQGRGPSVEELNGEGFPYSPYVLRRPELLAPAAMASGAASGPASGAASGGASAAGSGAAPAPAGGAAPPAAAPTVAVPPQPLAPAVPAPVLPQPVASQPADPFAGVPQRDTIDASLSVQPAGYGASHGVHTPVVAPPAPAAEPAQYAPPEVEYAEPAEDSDGIGGLFASAEPVFATVAVPDSPPAGSGTAVFPVPGAVPAQDAVPTAAGAAPATQPEAPAGRRRGVLVALMAVLALVIVIGGAALVVSRLHRAPAERAAPAGSTQAAPTLAKGRIQQVDGLSFRVEQARTDSTCVDHAYGQVATSFSTTDCTGLSRALYSVQIGGHAAVAAVSHVRMPDAAAAEALRTLADRSGTGNVDDLLREGIRYGGGPQKLLPDSEYASALGGTVVTIVETSWVDAADKGAANALDAAAQSGLQLAVPPFPGR